MGELADRVAGLEREVAQAREALRIVERLDEEIEDAGEEIRSVYEALCNLSWELDGEIADHNYMAVEGLAYEMWNLVDNEQLRRAIDTNALLSALRDGNSVPAASVSMLMSRAKDVKESHPTLTQEGLDEEFQASLDRAAGIWKEITTTVPGTARMSGTITSRIICARLGRRRSQTVRCGQAAF
jgi:hypothetical protein